MGSDQVKVFIELEQDFRQMFDQAQRFLWPIEKMLEETEKILKKKEEANVDKH